MYEVTHALDAIRRQSRIAPGELRVLEYIVHESLAGRDAELNQKTIAADVFARDLTSFDPRADSIVRTTAANLRDSLLAYYAGPGRGDSVVIELPKGTYAPRFSRRVALSPRATSKLWSARVALESRTVTGFQTAINHLNAVLAEAPRFSLALALKAEALATQAIHGSRPRPCLEQARECSQAAIDTEAPAWQAWIARGVVESALDLDYGAAARSYASAIATSPEASSHVWHTAFLVGRGRPAEGVAILQRTIDHFGYCNPAYLGDLAMLQILSRDYDSANETLQTAIEAAPHYHQHYLNLAILREAQGDAAEAVRVLDRTPLKIHERPVTWGLRALFAGLSGSKPVAQRRLTWLRAAAKTGTYIPPDQIGACLLGLGDLDGAVRYLEASLEERCPLVMWYHAYPFFRHLRGHAGFERLLDRIGVVRY